MPRCYACDCELTDYESTRKSRVTGEYLDLCDFCFGEIADVFIDVEERLDLQETEKVEVESHV
jgi:hypothetical protein